MSEVRRVKRQIHRRKLFDGLATAEEIHIRALGQQCTACKRPALIAIRTFAPLDDLDEDTLRAIALQHDGTVPVVDTRYGRAVRIGEAFACHSCAPAARRAAAKHPSSWFVDIDEGPGPDRLTVSPGG